MKVNFETIYEHIGYLMYAIASGNEKFSIAGAEKLKALVDTLWNPMTGDVLLNIHLTRCLQNGIEYCQVNFLTPEEVFSNFENYFRIHAIHFNSTLREKIISTSRSVFDVFMSPGGAIEIDRIKQLMGSHELRESK